MNTTNVFKNRQDAGKQLAALLKHYQKDLPIILGMPRGGVVVAFEVAQALLAPLDVIVARKVGAPNQPEYAIGAIAPGGVRVFNPEVAELFNFTEIEELVVREQQEMERRINVYRAGRPALDCKGRVIIIVDDGVATGQSALAAIRAVRKMQPKRIIFAVGVCASSAVEMLKHEVDEVICIIIPEFFYAVGEWFKDFAQTTDDEVVKLLQKSKL
jgi:putative phosphoribosyl transferase